ncbi:MAG: hypothetical protein QM687_10030 [Ferruginibacter sp.]
MKNRSWSKMSTDTLLRQLKTMKIMTGMLIGMLLLLFVLNIVMIFRKGFNAASLIVPVALLPIVFVNANTVKEIKKELDSRNAS